MKKISILFALTFFLTFTVIACLASQMGVVKGSYINVRQDASFSSRVVTKKLRGESYNILFEDRGWRKVSFSDGVSGWIFPSLIERRGANPTEGTEGAQIASGGDVPPLPAGIASPTKASTSGKKIKPGKKERAATNVGNKPALEAIGASVATSTEPVAPAAGTGTTSTADGAKAVSGATEIMAPPIEEATVEGLSKTSKTAEDFYNEAIDQYEKKKYSDALDANREALKQAPRNAQIMNNMANCFFKIGKLDDAITQWRKALEISPKSAKICNNLGIAYYQMDENDKAIEFYKKAILFEPQFPDPYYNIASVFGFKGLFQNALEYYRKYLGFAPDATMKQLTEERIEYCKKQMEGAKNAPNAKSSNTGGKK